MNNKLPVLCSALALSILTALPSQAHELRRLGDGKGKFGERFRVAFGLTGEPAREDEQNGIDFTSLFYQDGSSDGNVVDTRRPELQKKGDGITFDEDEADVDANGDPIIVAQDVVDIKKIEILFFKNEPNSNNPFGYEVSELLNSEVICDKTTTPPNTAACIGQFLNTLNTFGDPTNPQPDTIRNKYTNSFRPTDSGVYGFKLTGCIEDNAEQPDDFPAQPYEPSGPFCFTDETFICGAGSKDPRNNPEDPEFDPENQTHSFSCITDAVAFGAKSQENGKDKDSYRDNDKYSVPSDTGQ